MSDVLPSFDSLPDDNAQGSIEQASVSPPQAQPDLSAAGSFDALADDTDKFSTPGQQIKAGAEGLAKGVLGPLAPYLEKKLGAVGSDIRARAEANPITHGIGEGVGLVGGALTGVGEGAVLEKAGQLAVDAVGLTKPVSYAAKVGSAAVQQAAEMAVLQSGDEVSKMILRDPEASSESAIANIGLATALGGAGGAFITGAVSPLWKATIGTKVEQVLGGLKDHLDGTTRLIMPKEVEQAANTLGINLSPEMRAGLSGDPKAAQMFNELREIQHPVITAGLKQLETDTNEAVLSSLGKSTEEIANYSKAEGGKHAMDSFEKEYKTKYEPIAKEFEEITGPFKESPVYPAQIATLADKITTTAQEKGWLGADIPQNKVVDSVMSRLAGIKTADDLAKLNTTINNLTHGDFRMNQIRRELKDLVTETQHSAVAFNIGKDAPELMSRYDAVREQYAKFAKMSGEIGSELGLGKFVGPKSLLRVLTEKRSPEQFLNKLSPKGNAEILNLLSKHFPQTLESIRSNELQSLLKPAVLGAKGESPINSKILNNAIERMAAGEPERLKFAMPQSALDKIRAANTLNSAIPGMKSSGTAGWQQKMMASVPQSALAAVAMITGHNPVFGYIGGHLGKLLARDLPDAIKLGLLKFMASDQPIKAEGFKSMVDFMHNTIKGQNLLAKATSNVFKSGAQVLTESQMPAKADREKLDKIVTKFQDKPDTLIPHLSKGETGHYLPANQAALTKTSTQALQYLQKLKPQPYKPGPLDPAIEPRPDEVARYNRALDIANQPAVVLDHMKHGTLQMSDLQDLKGMYPALYNKMANDLTNAIVNKHHAEEPIPYKTRMGVSLFLGQPMDATMTPMSIQAAQPKPPQQPPQMPKQKGTSTKSLGKINQSYQTPSQSRESSRVNKD